MRRAGIEPHLDDVGDLVPLRGIVLVAEEEGRIGRVPGVGPLALDGLRDALDDCGVAQRLARLLSDQDRDRHAPGALARDAPIPPGLHPRRGSVPALWREPTLLLDRP